jgi:endonuclease G
VSGWSVQYSSATNTGPFSGIQPIGGVIGPGEYFLISLASGGAVGSDLPTPNVSGGGTAFNMSGTAGKVALVRNGDVLAGPCVTTLADPDLVDFVGYGTTANCNEGGTNAPAPSNTTAAVRKNGGLTDTNVNGNDFLAQTPTPRSTAPIAELGPAVVNTDPGTNETDTPVDGSVIVTFSEPVDVSTGWYDINCVSSGNHNDATVAPGAPNSFVITPNSNFAHSEQCTVTVFAAFVRDTDLDDSNPNTDTLAANYTWTFTVVTPGAARPFSSDVHLTMGNPSGAVADPAVPNNYLMVKPDMSISYNRDRGTPNWTSWHLSGEWDGSVTRTDTFRPDPEVLPSWYRVLGSDYFGSGFDRGHVMPSADRTLSLAQNHATFLMSNMIPQSPDNNQGPWASMENDLRTYLPANELYIVMGGVGTGGTGSNGFATTIANGHVSVPSHTWKVVLFLPNASGDDVARVTASTTTLAVLIPNVQGIRNNNWRDYIVTVDHVESLTGYDFFPNVPDAIEAAIESGTNGANPPGAASQTVTATEDQDQSITLSGASPTGGTLTYTIVSGPSNGTLNGSGASRTYTPLPDFFGPDSFTYTVNDGTATSNVATVSIAVSEVNDAPVAANDNKTAVDSAPLTFNASDLTANDSAGPANESAQTLTVSSVTPTADTHGTVVLSGGQVTYTSSTGYTGPASFTYTVCDNGTTAGAASSLCAVGTVLVTVNAAPPATHLTLTAPANVPNGVPFDVTVTARDASSSIVVGYRGTVRLTSTSAGTLPADYTFVAGDNGSHTFSVTLTTQGAQTLTATDTNDASITGTANTVVGCATPVSTVAPIVTSRTACERSSGNVASTTLGGVAFAWTITNGTITEGQGTSTIVYTAGASGATELRVTVTDACGGVSTGYQSVPLAERVAILTQTRNLQITSGQSATLNVVTSTPTADFQWYRGTLGDASTPVGTNSATYSTGPLSATTHYWVQVFTRCGSVQSLPMTVTVPSSSKRRAARK